MFDGDLSSIERQNEGMTPASPSSMVSSPMSSSFAPEHRELKRQHDRARRDSRLSARMRRYSNTSYGEASSIGSVDPMSSGGIGYPSGPVSMSMLAETPSSMAPTSYVPQYSPAMSDQSLPSQAFHLPYQQPLYVVQMKSNCSRSRCVY